jgi:undecaprenyl phosphate-alpha-L-ara4N flippase subunit ArnF
MTGRGARWLGVAALGASIALSALGQLGMKAGMENLRIARAAGEIAWSLAAPSPIRAALLWTAAGLAAYGLSLLAWLAVLVRYRLSYAYPLLALSYVLVYVGATRWPELAEPATPLRTIGTLLILAGVALASLTGERAARY